MIGSLEVQMEVSIWGSSVCEWQLRLLEQEDVSWKVSREKRSCSKTETCGDYLPLGIRGEWKNHHRKDQEIFSQSVLFTKGHCGWSRTVGEVGRDLAMCDHIGEEEWLASSVRCQRQVKWDEKWQTSSLRHIHLNSFNRSLLLAVIAYLEDKC